MRAVLHAPFRCLLPLTALLRALPLDAPCQAESTEPAPGSEKGLWIIRGYCGYLRGAKPAPAAFHPLFGLLKNPV